MGFRSGTGRAGRGATRRGGLLAGAVSRASDTGSEGGKSEERRARSAKEKATRNTRRVPVASQKLDDCRAASGFARHRAWLPATELGYLPGKEPPLPKGPPLLAGAEGVPPEVG